MENSIPIEELLFEEEGTTLDFKREQYVFVSANDHQKSEIIKDILAFANAWRRSDAYILLGVEEVKGGRGKPLGVDTELDDAQLQQLVNSKTQKPITFTYKTLLVDGVKIGVIKIPIQSRPYYLEKDYGKLKKHVVYVRRGSSTDEASPEEVHSMGRAEVTETIEVPDLRFEFANSESRATHGPELTFETTLLEIPPINRIPDYQESTSDPFGIRGLSFGHVRSDYYRDLVEYYYLLNKSQELSFSLVNNSSTTVSDVRVEILIEKQNQRFNFVLEDDFPEFPRSRSDLIANIRPISEQFSRSIKPSIRLQDIGHSYRIEVPFEKVQPRQTVFSDQSIFIAANEDFHIQAKIAIYADNIPMPIECALIMKCSVRKKPGWLEDIKKMHEDFLRTESV